MRARLLALASLSIWGIAGAGPACASDLVWEVESPFRLFKTPQAFALHEQAFRHVRGDADKPLPADIVWRTERRLNDPDCKDRSTPDNAARPRARATGSRGSAGRRKTLAARLLRQRAAIRAAILTQCERKYSWGTAKEDYVLPEAHTVHDRACRPSTAQAAGNGECVWRWQPRVAGGQGRDAASLPASRQAHHRARALFDRSQPVRRHRHGQAARTARELRRSGRDRRGPVHRGARRFLRLRRKQSRPARHLQRRAAR